MKLKVKMTVSESGSSATIDVENDMGYSINDWNTMSEDEQQTALQKYVDDDANQPYWVVENFEEK